MIEIEKPRIEAVKLADDGTGEREPDVHLPGLHVLHLSDVLLSGAPDVPHRGWRTEGGQPDRL